MLKNDTGRNGASFRGENVYVSSSAEVLDKTSDLAISRCCFAHDGKEMNKSEKRTCRACKAIRDFKIYDAVVNENATKQQCHLVKRGKIIVLHVRHAF